MKPLTKEKQCEFEKAEICWICQGKFDKLEEKVRDHCHFTGKYWGGCT